MTSLRYGNGRFGACDDPVVAQLSLPAPNLRQSLVAAGRMVAGILG